MKQAVIVFSVFSMVATPPANAGSRRRESTPESPIMLAGDWVPEDPHQIDYEKLPHYEAFFGLVAQGVTTVSTKLNRENVDGSYEEQITLGHAQRDLMFDPQTSGGLLLAVAPAREVPPVQRVSLLLMRTARARGPGPVAD